MPCFKSSVAYFHAPSNLNHQDNRSPLTNRPNEQRPDARRPNQRPNSRGPAIRPNDENYRPVVTPDTPRPSTRRPVLERDFP